MFLEPEPEVDDTAMFDYSLLFNAALWDYYCETADKTALDELWTVARKQIEIAEERIDEKGIVQDSDVLGWCFLDWSLELNKQAGAQGVLLYAIKNAIRIAEVLELQDEIEVLEKKHTRYRDAARKFLWDENRGLFISGVQHQISYASQIWMILGGAVNSEEASGILHRIKEADDSVGMVTPYMYHNYVQANIEAGQYEEAIKILKAYWGGMADMGADTFWELYNPENPSESPYGGTIVNSYCHAWSCAPAYFLRKYVS